MKNFGYNIFNAAISEKKRKSIQKEEEAPIVVNDFNSVSLDVNEKDGAHPEKIKLPDVLTSAPIKVEVVSSVTREEAKKVKFVWGKIKGSYKKFEDGDLVSVELEEDLQIDNMFMRNGNIIRGVGWMIDDRIFINLGHGRSIILYDTNSQQGITLKGLKNSTPIILKVYQSS